MSEPKTKKTQASVAKFLSTQPEQKREDCRVIIALMQTASGTKAEMWGSAIIGFGTYHYKYATGREGDWMRIALSPRKQNISIYIMDGFSKYEKLLAKLGKHKLGRSCLYINKLEDVNIKVLRTLIERSIKNMKKRYPD